MKRSSCAQLGLLAAVEIGNWIFFEGWWMLWIGNYYSLTTFIG
jgi:hypothetical protein